MTTPEALKLYDHAQNLERCLERLRLAESCARHRAMAGYPGLVRLLAELTLALDWVRDEQEKSDAALKDAGLPTP